MQKNFDMPDYVPRYWDLDEHGNKKNKVFTGTRDMGGWNCLTIAKFERLCKQNDLRIVKRLGHHLSGHALVEKVSALLYPTAFRPRVLYGYHDLRDREV